MNWNKGDAEADYGPEPLTWFVRSDKDPRWSATGRAESVLDQAEAIVRHVRKMAKLYGTPLPPDLTVGAGQSCASEYRDLSL